jgi:transposase
LPAALPAYPDNEYAMIDATIVRAHQHSAGARKKKGVNQAIGRSRGGLTTKIHMIVDALGNPLAFTLTPGQVHDITQAETLTAQVQPEAVLADKGYDADAYIASLRARDQAGHPPKGESQEQTRLRFRALPGAQFGRTILPIHQTLPRHRHTLRENRAQLLRRPAASLRARLA